jgi:hypothetical protein
MYTITDANKLPGKKELCHIGYPVHLTPDLCIYNTADPYRVISINSQVLREALLSDPGFILFTLGIKVEDANKGRNVK